MYKQYGYKIGTRPISVRLRRDILEWFEMEGINKNAFINDCVIQRMKIHQRNPVTLGPWIAKNR